jgi:hypothetical protein
MRDTVDLNCMACPPKYRQLGSFPHYFSGKPVISCNLYNLYIGKKKVPVPTIFIGGNHEASNYLYELCVDLDCFRHSVHFNAVIMEDGSVRTFTFWDSRVLCDSVHYVSVAYLEFTSSMTIKKVLSFRPNSLICLLIHSYSLNFIYYKFISRFAYS